MTVLSIEILLAEHDFARALARSLLRDPDAAEDVAQRAWLLAWQRPPRDGATMRVWLGRVVRRLVCDDARDARRRSRHEAAAAAALDLAPSSAEVLEREEARRQVVEAVLALAEPYRSVVLLRYFDGLTPVAIAARLRVPGATVRAQLARGREMLRRRLERRSVRGWVAVVGPLANLPRPGVAASLVSGVVWMSMHGKVALAACVLGLAGLWWSLAHGSHGAPLPAPAGPSATPLHVESEATVRERKDALDAAAAARRPVAAAEDTLVVVGLAKHRGLPCPDVALALEWFAGVGTEGAPAQRVAVRSAADGTFTWRGLAAAEPRTVVARSDDPRVRVWSDAVVVAAGTTEVELAATVSRLDCELHGVVRDERGQPIEGAHVAWNGQVAEAVRTDAKGRYAMPIGTGVDARPVVFGAEGFAPQLVAVDVPDGASSWQLDARLLPGHRISGRVVDGDGTPVVGARVAISGASVFSVHSADDGAFVVPGVAASNQLVTADKEGYQTGQAFWHGGSADELEIVLRPGETVTGRVLDERGQPVLGARIELVRERGERVRAWSLGDGSFHFADLGGGEWQVVVAKQGFARQRQVLLVREGGTDVVVRLERGWSVRGRVIDETGHPVAGASCYAETLPEAAGRTHSLGSRDDSDGDGQFVLDDLPPDAPCMVYAFAKGYERGSVEVAARGAAALELRLRRAPGVAGRVVDASTGEALSVFTVRVATEADFTAPWLRALPFRSVDGTWASTPSGLVVGQRVFVEVCAPGYAPARAEAVAMVDPPSGQTVVALRRGVTIRGRVLDAVTGEPVAGARVWRLDASDDATLFDAGRAPAAHSDASGGYRIDAVPAGDSRLRVEHAGFPPFVHGPLEVGVGPGELTLDLRLERGVRVAGRLVGFAGVAALELMAHGRRVGRAEVGADGAFAFEGVGPGRCYATVPVGEGEARVLMFDVGGEDVADLVVRAVEGSGAVHGKVAGFEEGEVHLSSAGGEARVTTLRGGRFTFTGLAPGTYRLHAESARGAAATADVTVADHQPTTVELEPRR